MHALGAVFYKDIVTGATRSSAGVLKYPPVVNWKVMSGPITWDRNTFGMPPTITTAVRTVTGTSSPSFIIGRQKTKGPIWTIIPQEFRNTELLYTSINRIPSNHKDPTQNWSKVIGSKLANRISADVYARC